jgi:hypothetical protein
MELLVELILPDVEMRHEARRASGIERTWKLRAKKA